MANLTLTSALIAAFANANDLYLTSDKKAAKKAAWVAVRAAFPSIPAGIKLGFDDQGDNAFQVYVKGSTPRQYLPAPAVVAAPAPTAMAQAMADATTHADFKGLADVIADLLQDLADRGIGAKLVLDNNSLL